MTIAYDAAGGGALPDLIALTGDASRVVTIVDPEAAALGVRFTTGRTEPRVAEALPLVARLFEEGKFHLPVEYTFGMNQVGAAHDLSEAGHVRGKLVVLVDHREGAGA